MRTVAHLGNLMIGWTPTGILSEMAESLHRLQPDVVTVSGNLTASGNKRELRNARAFLDSVPSPQVVVPGELDAARPFVGRLLPSSGRFNRLVENNATPCFADSELLVIGLNTVRARRGKPHVVPSERERVMRLVEASDPGALKVLVSFRPVFMGDRLDPKMEDERVFRSRFDVLLAGPLAPRAEERSFRPSDTTLFIACANRPEGVGFNLLRIRPPEIVLERYGWQHQSASFALLGSETLRLAQARWTA